MTCCSEVVGNRRKRMSFSAQHHTQHVSTKRHPFIWWCQTRLRTDDNISTTGCEKPIKKTSTIALRFGSEPLFVSSCEDPSSFIYRPPPPPPPCGDQSRCDLQLLLPGVRRYMFCTLNNIVSAFNTHHTRGCVRFAYFVFYVYRS